MSLVETTHASGAASAEGRQIVTFNVDDRVFGIDVGVVREIKGWQEATPLPHAAPYVRGVINLRGLILAVYDLRARLGGGLTSATPKHVNLVVDVADRTAGLLVDAVSDIVDVPREMASDSDRILPAEGSSPPDDLIRRLTEIGYTAAISIELQNPRLWRVPPRQFGEIAMTSLRKLLGQAQMEGGR